MCAQSLRAAVSVITAPIHKDFKVVNNSFSSALSLNQSGCLTSKKNCKPFGNDSRYLKRLSFLTGEYFSLTCKNTGPKVSLNAVIPAKNSVVIASASLKLLKWLISWGTFGQNLKSLLLAFSAHFEMASAP